MDNTTTYKAVVVTHTHWDREWYSAVEEYRFRLIAFFDRLLAIQKAEKEYHSFWLDGQVIPLEDVAAVWPERMPEIEAAMRAGKILVGPWYVLADQMIVGGEPCVRNLMKGMRLTASYGQDNRIGYVPDNFGQMSQLPQILKGFGIVNAIFWRGYRLDDIDSAETWWTGADGTRVRVVCLTAGYSNTRGAMAGAPESCDRLDMMMPRMKQYCGSGTLLIMNGIDHALPTPNLPGVCETIRQRYPGVDPRHGSLAEYLAAVRGAHDGHRELKGELFHVPGLDGCLSNRPVQKRLNRLLENRLAHYAEPLTVLARAGGREMPAVRGFLDRAWQLLLRCHPHDTICGCHADSVAADMEARLRRGLQITTEVEHWALAAMAGVDPNYAPAKDPCWVMAYNPSPWARTEVIETGIDLPAADLTGGLEAVDSLGRPCPVVVLGTAPDARRVYSDLTIPVNQEILRARVLLRLNLPPGGVLWAKVSAKRQVMASQMEVTGEADGRGTRSLVPNSAPNVLESARLRVTVHADGSFDLLDVNSGLRLDGLNRLQSETDMGDLYAFRKALNPTVTPAAAGRVSCTEDNPLRRTVTVRTTLSVNGKDLPTTVHVTLPAGKDRIEVRVEIENDARDFRIQSAFPVPSAGTGRAHMPFDLTPRKPVAPERFPLSAERKQADTVSVPQPLQHFVQFDLQRGGALTLMTRGICEYTWETAGEPRLTLMRATGEITRALRRHPAAGGQCPGLQVFEYAIKLTADAQTKAWEGARDAYDYNLPPAAATCYAEPATAPAGVALDNPHWLPAALKPCEDGPGFVVRFWNMSDAPQTGRVRTGMVFGKVQRARLDETPTEELRGQAGEVEVRAEAKEIVTLIFRP